MDWSKLLSEATGRAIEQSAATASLPIHLSTEPQIPEDPDDLVPYLPAPVRSGIILTRADPSRAAIELCLGVRVGERAFALRSLLGQDREAVMDWVATEARRQANAVASVAANPALVEAWKSRALRTASILGDLIAPDRDVVP